MTDKKQIVKESTHWYAEDGTPVYEVPLAKGDGWRKTTLRDARQMQLAPGVTTIIRCAAAPALVRWQQRQAIMSALTLPRGVDEPEERWLQRIEMDMNLTAKDAAKEGTRIHTAIELAMCEERYDPAYTDHVRGVVRVLGELAGPWAEWDAEKGCAHYLGYGTKADLSNDNWVIDFKGKDGDEDDLDRLRTYDSHWMQLAATRAALETQDGATTAAERNYEEPRRRCAIIYVSRTHPGVCRAIEVSDEELDKGWAMFTALLHYWQAKSNYKPDWTC